MDQQKKNLRQEILRECARLPRDNRLNFEQAAFKHLAPLLSTASSIAIYHSLVNEFNMATIIQYCLRVHKKLYQPVAYKNSRIMLLEDFSAQRQEIFSPTEYFPSPSRQWYNLDLILLPLVAVDALGYRLGKGGGYYDATLGQLTTKPPYLCGVGYSCQLLQNPLPHEIFDVKLDYFVSEQGLISF